MNNYFIEYYPHKCEKDKRDWSQDHRKIVSIDPGIVNFAFRIEKRFLDGKVETIAFEKVSVKDKPLTVENRKNNTYNNITTFLDKYLNEYQDCHYILIEEQPPLRFGVSRIYQHVCSYFCFNLKDKELLPSIIGVSPKLKGKFFNFEKGKNKKREAINKAKEIFENRNDIFSLEILKNNKKKLDDLCDTVCQIEAFVGFYKDDI